MNVVQVEYRKLVNTGNFEHQALSVTVQLEDGETAHEAVARAKKFVEAELKPKPTGGFEVKQAQQIAALCEQPDEIPF
jgi:hydroxymethylpyrimidine/phosphomethylpyrimidine kinase